MKIGQILEGYDFDRSKIIWESLSESNQAVSVVMSTYNYLEKLTNDFGVDIVLTADIVLTVLDDLFQYESILDRSSEVFNVYNYMIDYLRKVNTYK